MLLVSLQHHTSCLESNTLRTRTAHNNYCTYPSYVQSRYCLWRHAGCQKLFDCSIPNSVSVTLLAAVSGIIYKSLCRIYRRCVCLSLLALQRTDTEQLSVNCAPLCWEQGAFSGWGAFIVVVVKGSLWQSCVVVTAVCDSRALLLQQSATVVYCCYGSLWQSRIVVLRQSVTVVYFCCYSSLWQSCIVVATAVCLSVTQFCTTLKLFSLSQKRSVSASVLQPNRWPATDALQYAFCGPVTVQSLLNAVVGGSGDEQWHWWHCWHSLGLQLCATAVGNSLNIWLKLSSLNSGLYWLPHSTVLAVHKYWLLWNVIK